MTVPVQTPVSSSVANGLTTVFPFGFKVAAAEDLSVTINGVKQTGGYTVTGVGDVGGGNVEFAVAPASGSKVVRYLDPVLKRDVDYQQFGDWMAAIVNLDIDRIWLALQNLKQNDIRALKLPVETITDQVIPEDAAARANKGIKFDDEGNVTVSEFDPDFGAVAAEQSAAAAEQSAIAASNAAASASAASSAASASAASAAQSASDASSLPVAAPTHAAAAKNTPSDGDEFPLADSTGSWVLKKVNWFNLKVSIRQALGSMINGATSKPGVADGDKLAIADSEASSATKSLTWAVIKSVLKSYFDTLYQPVGGSIYVPVRQTVLSGPVDSSGMAFFGGATGGTVVTAAGTLKVTAAAGGDANVTGSITNPSWSGLSTNGKMYLYVEIDGSGNASTGSTSLAPIYQWGGAYGTAAGQHTFNIQEMTTKVGNGSSATQVNRVFVGEVTVAGGVVTAISWYALMGRHDTGWYAVVPGTSYNKAHNLGFFPGRFTQLIAQNADGSGWCVQSAVHGNSSGVNQGTNIVTVGKLYVDIRTGANYIAYFADASGTNFGATAGYARQLLDRGW